MSGKPEAKDTALALAELAHELRQPLTGIRASAELLLESRPADEVVRARAATIVQQAQRIQLTLDRARRPGAPPAVLTRAHLNQAVEMALSLLELEATKQGAVFERELAPDLPAVAAEQIAVEQVLGNLLRNALQAVAPTHGRVRVRTSAVEDGVEVLIEDDGPGVPEAQRARLFTPFASGRAGGSGLGLYISKALATEAAGSLELLEGEGGARFRLRLPRA